MNRAIAHGVHHPSITHEERKRCYSTVAVNHSGTHKGAKTYALQQDGGDNDKCEVEMRQCIHAARRAYGAQVT